MTNEERYKKALEKIRSRAGCEDSLFFTIANEALHTEPEYEEVTIEGWRCVKCHEYLHKFGDRCARCGYQGYDQADYIRLTGTYLREKKPKVKRREEIKVNCGEWEFLNKNVKYTRGMNSTFWIEWEEEQ